MERTNNETKRNYEAKAVMKTIKEGKDPASTEAWLEMMKALRNMPVYIEMAGQERTVLADQDSLKMYRLYLKKPDMNAQAYDFMKLEEEARELEISLLISVSKEEPESLLLEEPSGFMYFVKAEKSSKTISDIEVTVNEKNKKFKM